MNVTPKNYDRKEYIKYLTDNNIPIKYINVFSNLPDFVDDYGLKIKITHNIKLDSDLHEINYYSNNKFEHLFKYKQFDKAKDGIIYAFNHING